MIILGNQLRRGSTGFIGYSYDYYAKHFSTGVQDMQNSLHMEVWQLCYRFTADDHINPKALTF